MKRGQFMNYGNACFILLSMLLLLTLPARAQEETEYYPVEEYYEEGANGEEYEELPDIEEIEWEDEVEKAGITSNNWILSPFDSLGESLHFLFLFDEESKIKYTLELANERDYELRLLKRKSELKANSGDWKAVEKYSRHISNINDKYNDLLLEADEKFSLYQEEETDEEKIDSIYNEAGKVIDRHTLNVISIKRFVEKYSNQEGTSDQALENLNQVVEYEGLAEEVETEEPGIEEPALPESPLATTKPVLQQQQTQQIPGQKRVMKPPLKQAQAQLQQPMQQTPQTQLQPMQQQAQEMPTKKKPLAAATGLITAALSETKGVFYKAADYLINILQQIAQKDI